MIPKTKVPSNYESYLDESYLDGFQSGVNWCKKYGIPDAPSSLNNSSGEEKSEWIKVETKDKEYIQICFSDAATGTCFDYSVKHLKEILMKDMFPEQPSNDNAFVWTDELVLDFHKSYMGSESGNIYGYMDMWKQSKQPLSPSIPDNTVDWEIVTWFTTDKKVAVQLCGDIEGNLKAGYTIRSVCRISDNCLFTVGDIIEGAELDNHNIVSHHPTKIISIYLINGTVALGYGNGGAVLIQYAKKLPPQPLPTDTDKLTFHYAVQKSTLLLLDNILYPLTKPDEWETFATKEAAEQYILENKPCLSLNDVIYFANSLQEFVTQKLNQ